RMTTDDGALSRVIAPGGLADQLLANDGLIERVLLEDGVADRLLAEGGLLATLTAENGPLLKLAVVADTLNRLAPGLEALAPTIDALHDAVVTLSQVVNPLSNIADRIPIPGWRPRRSSTSVRSQRVIDAENRPDSLVGFEGLLSSVVEHSPCKRKVVSSILTGGSTKAQFTGHVAIPTTIKSAFLPSFAVNSIPCRHAGRRKSGLRPMWGTKNPV